MINISPDNDIIDSRDIIARIKELEHELNLPFWASEEGTDEITLEEIKEELKPLKALVEQCKNCYNWKQGETLISDNYFKEYAMQLANDLGLINDETTWPACHINWEAAAENLKQDYRSVDFCGSNFWIRA